MEIKLTQDMIDLLYGIGERYSWMDDSWPDMEDDMCIAMEDEYGCDFPCEKYVDEFIRNCHKYW